VESVELGERSGRVSELEEDQAVFARIESPARGDGAGDTDPHLQVHVPDISARRPAPPEHDPSELLAIEQFVPATAGRLHPPRPPRLNHRGESTPPHCRL
jgi:hypothetical protein